MKARWFVLGGLIGGGYFTIAIWITEGTLKTTIYFALLPLMIMLGVCVAGLAGSLKEVSR